MKPPNDSRNDPPDGDQQALIARAQGGDVDAREALLSMHLAALRGFVRLRLGRHLRAKEESIDLVQSICSAALEDLASFEYRDARSFRHWLLRRAENKIRARGRFWSRERRALAREAAHGSDLESLREVAHALTPSRAAITREELERFESAFLELVEDDRTVILLSRVAGLRHEDVAREMGRTPAATRSLLSRALARLATRLE